MNGLKRSSPIKPMSHIAMIPTQSGARSLVFSGLTTGDRLVAANINYLTNVIYLYPQMYLQFIARQPLRHGAEHDRRRSLLLHSRYLVGGDGLDRLRFSRILPNAKITARPVDLSRLLRMRKIFSFLITCCVCPSHHPPYLDMGFHERCRASPFILTS